MGLDMYWFSRGTKEEQAEALISGKEPPLKELGYFRKHYDLNDYMGDLYPEQFQHDYNTVELEIGWEELSAMKEFTNDSPDDNEKLETICHNITAALNDGELVVYWPWW